MEHLTFSKRIRIGLTLLCIFSFWISWRVAPGSANRIEFTWDQTNGFNVARVDRPTSLNSFKLLATPFDALVKVQAKRYIVFEL
jgi:hypothetical protein